MAQVQKQQGGCTQEVLRWYVCRCPGRIRKGDLWLVCTQALLPQSLNALKNGLLPWARYLPENIFRVKGITTLLFRDDEVLAAVGARVRWSSVEEAVNQTIARAWEQQTKTQACDASRSGRDQKGRSIQILRLLSGGSGEDFLAPKNTRKREKVGGEQRGSKHVHNKEGH